jgi:peptidoglycan/xylan/chitin deacetylase (PgdA/CDA1 family)
MNVFHVAITLDVDPDANIPIPGCVDAISSGLDRRVSLKACKDGLHHIQRLNTALNMPLTVFWEARTLHNISLTQPSLLQKYRLNEMIEHGCHGYRHEDFTGEDSRCELSYETVKDAITRSTQRIADILEITPAGFRAPYCRISKDLIAVLCDMSYQYDASVAVEIGRRELDPFVLDSNDSNTLWEIPLCNGIDSQGKAISGYLWQLFEARREVADYLEIIEKAATASPGGLFQIALHPWHIVVNQEGVQNPPSRVETIMLQVRELFEAISSAEHLHPTTLSAYLSEYLHHR